MPFKDFDTIYFIQLMKTRVIKFNSLRRHEWGSATSTRRLPAGSRFVRRFQRIHSLVAAAFLCFLGAEIGTAQVHGAAVPLEAGDFVEEVTRLKDLVFESGSDLYVAPSLQEQTDFRALADAIWVGDTGGAQTLADGLGYEVLEFVDNVSGSAYYGIREVLTNGVQTKGWGSYFVNPSFEADALVEVPHVLWDTNSWDVGAKSFRDARARGFLMAGAHRNANGKNTADVAHIDTSIFHHVHESWVGSSSATDAWQIHGFDLDKHASFPDGTDAVLSNGDGSVSSEVLHLDGRFDEDGLVAYAYNTLNPNDPLNLLVNDGVDGTTFSGAFDPDDKGLAGKSNDQGIYSRGFGGIFVHVELEQSIRESDVNRDLVSGYLSETLQFESSLLVIDSAVQSVGFDYQVTLEFNMPIDGASLQAADLIVDGLPALNVNLDSAFTATFGIGNPAAGGHHMEIIAGSILAVDGTAVGSWLSPFNIVADTQYVIKHAPRLQLGNAPLIGFPGSDSDQIELMWQTQPSGNGSEDHFTVQHRVAGSAAPWTLTLAINQIVIPSAGRVNHTAVIDDLSFDSEYEYRVRHLSGDVVVDEYGATFRTRLAPNDPSVFSFVAYGDSADIDDIDPFRNVQSRISAVDPAFALLLGDNVYDSGTHSESDARFDAAINPEASAWNSGHIDYVGFGNHDVQTDGSEINYSAPIPVGGVTAPVSGPAGEPDEHNYSFDYGNVHFATFDTNRRNSGSTLEDQLLWLEADLAATSATWKVVFGHHPVTGSPDKPESAADNYYQQVVPRLRAVGVDMLLMGHSHLYHRTYPLLGEVNGVETFLLDNDDSYDQGAGLVQVVAGTGGKSLRDGDFGQFPFNAAGFSNDTIPVAEYGFAQIDVTPDQLTVSYIAADDGATLDQFVITAGTDSQAPSATLVAPGDNGPGDLDPANDLVSVTMAQGGFDILLTDSSGIDHPTVLTDVVTVSKDAVTLVDSLDYTFDYNAATSLISLTPIAFDFGSGDYVVTLNGGANKIADMEGNQMAEHSFGIDIDTSVQVVSFQQGVSGYNGTVDTTIDQGAPNEDLSTETSLNIDNDSPGGSGNAVQSLLRFENLFGPSNGQIPTSATIFSATLYLDVSNAGSALELHRMLVNWNDTDTWNSLINGLSDDDLEASAFHDVLTGAVTTGVLELDVLQSLQAWQVDPLLNRGWAILPTGGNGIDFDSAEGAVAPRLEVQFSDDSNPDPDPDPDPLPSPGITLSLIDNETSEAGGTALLSVVLNSFPLADVTIDLSLSHLDEGTISDSAVTFTPGNWENAQVVTITGSDDQVDDGDVVFTFITSPAFSADPGYDGLDAMDVALTNLDDDVAAVAVDPIADLITTESGGTDTFSVVLESEPTANVTIELTSNNLLEGDVSDATLTFTPSDWNSPQIVTVTGMDDVAADGDVDYTIVAASLSADPIYDGMDVAEVALTNLDDDTSFYVVSFQQDVDGYTGTVDTMVDQGSPTENFSTEDELNIDNDSPGGSGNSVQSLLRFDDLFGERVGFIPSTATLHSATLYLEVSNSGSALSLHRMLADWNDSDTWASLDNGLSADDVEGVSASDWLTGSVSTGLLEVDVLASMQAWLSDPSSNQGWAILPTAGNGVDVDSSKGTIAPRLEVQFTADSNSYPDTSLPPGITMIPNSGLITTEAGGSDAFSVVLESEPTANVTIDLNSSNVMEGTVSEVSLIFTSDNWDSPQIVTVTGVDDADSDGDVDYTVVTSVISADPDYDGFDLTNVVVTNQDDEAPAAVDLYFSLTNSDSDNVLGLTGGDAKDEDIIVFDGNGFARVFDGSDVGVTGDIDALAVISETEILFSLTLSASLPGISGSVDDSDIVLFTATQWGDDTDGILSLYFDASDVELSSDNEDIDAIELLPDGDLLISTTGSFNVSGASGADEDLLRFTPVSLGSTTSGAWSLHIDSSDVGLGSEDIDGIASHGNGALHLSTLSSFSLDEVSGDDEDVFSFETETFGVDTSGVFLPTLLFDGSIHSLSGEDINALDVVTASW